MTISTELGAAQAEQQAQLHAYYDGELQGKAKDAFEKQLDRDPALAEQLRDLRVVGHILVGELEHRAQQVHEARFEQAWDAFERTVDRQERLKEAADARPSAIQQFFRWLAPVRIPLVTVAGAAGVVLLVMRFGGTGEPVGSDRVAEVVEPEAATESKSLDRGNTPAAEENTSGSGASQLGTGNELAQAPKSNPPQDMTDFPSPDQNDAEIERIEFSGHSGTISHIEGSHGTTTVIWVTEDQEPVNTERSL